MMIIDFKKVSLKYEDEYVLKNISLSIKEGEHTVVLGPNGSGKSTLIKLISCELYPSITKEQTTREILGQSRWEVAKLREHFGIVTNDLHNSFAFLCPELSAIDTVISGFFGTLGIFDYQVVSKEHSYKAIEALKQVGIAHLEHKKIGAMSTGELRRTLVARALVHPIKALLLDEPTIGLDLRAQLSFIEMVRSLANSGVSTILVTHHIEEIFSEIDRVVMLKDGTILADGTKKDTLTSHNLSRLFDMELEIIEQKDRYSIIF